MTSKAAFEQFIKVRRAVTTWSTQCTYRKMTSSFFRMSGVGASPVEKINQETVARWAMEMREARLSPNTIRKKLDILKIFFAWCRSQNLMSVDPMIGLPIPRPAAVHKVPFTYEQHQRVLAVMRTRGLERNDRPSYWPHACILGWHTGLRISDCAQMLWSQVDFISDVITAEPMKLDFARQRIVIPMEPELRCHLIGLYDLGIGSDWVNPEFRHEYLANPRLLVDIFRKTCDSLGLYQHSYHGYRHAFVSRLLNAGADAVVISQMTGQSLETIKSYAHISIDAKREALARARAYERQGERPPELEVA